MLVKTFCAAVNGLEVTTVTVEVSMSRGVQFLIMCGIVHANSKYLHVAPILRQKYEKNRQFPIIRPFFLREGNISLTCMRKISYV